MPELLRMLSGKGCQEKEKPEKKSLHFINCRGILKK